MNRIDACFAQLNKAGKKALIPYITTGDPSLSVSLELMHKLVESGADIIELGVPFSDPMADGPVIQRACERALENNVSILDVIALVKTFRETNTATPIVLMGYLNPIERIGYDTFADACADAQVDGVLAVDMPPEESNVLLPLLNKHNISSIFLLAPTSTDKRIEHVSQIGSGYVYYVSLKGVTGSASLDVADVEANIARLTKHIKTPICVGFGISDGESAKNIGQYADGVIVGSVFIKALEAGASDNEKILNAVALNTELAAALAELA